MGNITLAMTYPPEVFPEVPLTVTVPQFILRVVLKMGACQVLHNITDSGYTNQLELEVKTSELPDLKEE